MYIEITLFFKVYQHQVQWVSLFHSMTLIWLERDILVSLKYMINRTVSAISTKTMAETNIYRQAAETANPASNIPFQVLPPIILSLSTIPFHSSIWAAL